MALLDDFEAVDVETIRRFISTHQEEHLLLDFKRANSIDLTDQKDKEHFARCLAGFANADGGLVIWGVATKKTARGIESADSVAAIEDIDQFAARLNELTGSLASPRVEGVRHKKIFTSGRSGVVVSMIPSTDGGPHMAKAGIDRYIRRHGDRLLPMEHYEVADMFGRRQRPDLRIAYKLRAGGATTTGEGTKREFRITVSIENRGRGSATAPFVELQVAGAVIRQEGVSLSHHAGSGPLLELVQQNDRPACFIGRSDFVIHPGTTYDVATLRGSIQDSEQIVRSVKVWARVAAHNHPVTKTEQTFDSRELLRAVGRTVDNDDQ